MTSGLEMFDFVASGLAMFGFEPVGFEKPGFEASGLEMLGFETAGLGREYLGNLHINHRTLRNYSRHTIVRKSRQTP